jgi:phage terminase Nu1 subunit (DNA packaging protein)
MSERIGTARTSEITGLSQRRVQELAAQGIIPSGARLAGAAGHWSFDETAVRQWVRQKEIECQRTSPGGAKAEYRSDAYKSVGATFDEGYERLIKRKLKNGHKP